LIDVTPLTTPVDGEVNDVVPEVADTVVVAVLLI